MAKLENEPEYQQYCTVATTYHQLSVGREQPSTVSLHLAILPAQAVFHSEPVELTGKTHTGINSTEFLYLDMIPNLLGAIWLVVLLNPSFVPVSRGS